MNAFLLLAALALPTPSVEFKCPAAATLEGFEDQPVLILDGMIVDSDAREAALKVQPEEVYEVAVLCWDIELRSFPDPDPEDPERYRRPGIQTIHVTTKARVEEAEAVMNAFLNAQADHFRVHGEYALTLAGLQDYGFETEEGFEVAATDDSIRLVAGPASVYTCQVEVHQSLLSERSCGVSLAPASSAIGARWDAQQMKGSGIRFDIDRGHEASDRVEVGR